ncbi:TetR/AcrR family transcriptional regulator [Herbiconiux ginsengi]|uniref:Transcriptional regulator, TetR family n=1 Tax=Herbiconiux ginsengi TaxID=381665 RepID=A0A1H3L9R5_9MICO|nr:TetR/AcrR family transcriptional regulator [Herbiconiux ginsengi]SDY60929.1 transcriptional regulator, TetR family [Herbiconiux ginsengi]
MAAIDETSRRRGPYRKTEARRRDIIAAAQQVFASTGYRAGSLRDIGTVAGIDPSSILHHFPTKEALLEAVLEDKEKHDFEVLPALDDVDPHLVPRAMLELAERNSRVPHMIALYAILSAESTTAGHPSADYFRQRSERTRRDFRLLFQRMADAGLLADGVDVDYAATSTFAIWDGIQIHWLIEPDAVSVPETLRRHLRLITRVHNP